MSTLSGFANVTRRLLADRLAALSLVMLLVYMIAAAVCEVYAFRCAITGAVPNYEVGGIEQSYQPPSSKHWLGTDYRGRDVFIRAVNGSRVALKVGLFAGIMSVVIGVTLGLLSGYFGGWVDDLVVWIYSTFASMPTLLFILAFSLLVGKGFLFPPLAIALNKVCGLLHADAGLVAVYVAIGVTGWVSLCRVVRAECASLRERPYIQAAKTLGFGSTRILIRHILPNLSHLVIVFFALRFAYAIMTEVIVSYLGFGVSVEPSWGVMIADGQQRLWRGVWWEIAGATGFMFFLVLSFNILGDALRDALDPRLN